MEDDDVDESSVHDVLHRKPYYGFSSDVPLVPGDNVHVLATETALVKY